MRNALASSHPLCITALAEATGTAERVSVINDAVADESDCLKATVGMLGEPRHLGGNAQGRTIRGGASKQRPQVRTIRIFSLVDARPLLSAFLGAR